MEIIRKRGDTYADEFTLTDKVTGEPVNLVGCSFVLTVDTRKAPSDITTKLYQVTGVITTPTSGKVLFSPTATDADRVGFFYYDVEMTDGTGKKRTISAGRYEYLQDITK